MVKGGVVKAGLTPDVDEPSSVGGRVRESTSTPHGFIEVGVSDLQESAVDIGKEILLGPLKAESVEPTAVSSVQGLALVIGLPPSVISRVRPPVKGRRSNVVAALGIGVVVTTRLHDINFSRGGPGTIGVIDRQHPDGRPQPVAYRHLCSDFNTAILDFCSLECVDAAREGRRDNARVAVGGVGGRDAAVVVLGGTGAIFKEIDDVVLLNEISALDGCLDHEVAILDENVAIATSGLFKLAIAKQYVLVNRCENSVDIKKHAYPKPPTCTSFVQMLGSSPLLKSSSRTGQYLW